ncbi:hypothetical protein ACLB2K_067062 [Fragaria x ananassa]
MQLIMQRLPLSDYLYCRDVSLCWGAHIDSKRWLPAVHHQLPWLLSNHYTDMQTFYIKTHVDDADDGYDYYSFVSDRKILKSDNMDDIVDYFYFWHCGGAIEGWLLMVSHRLSQDKSLFLLNPTSAARVMLPLRPHPIPPIRKVVASSVPTTTMYYVTCLHYVERSLLAFCMPGDRSWTLIEAEKALQFSDIEILDGKLYAVGNDVLEFVMVFDSHLDTHDSRLHTYTSQRLVTLHPAIKSVYGFSCNRRNYYLAKCSESKNLFMILYNQDPCTPSQNKEFEFKRHLNETVSILPYGNKDMMVKNSTRSGVFSLTDRSIKPMTIPKHHPCREANETIWFTPTPWN